MKNLLSLFDYSGNWSAPYTKAGWKACLIDIKHGIDIMSVDKSWIEKNLPEKVNGILAAPPCTDFSVSGAQYWYIKDLDGRTELSIRIVKKTLEIIEILKPDFWALENPVGRLPKLIPELGQPWYFQPWWFGDAHTKKTGLWGKFNRPEKTNLVEPEKVCSQGSWLMKLGGSSEKTKELRSLTPKGFAQAFFNANH